MASASSSTGNGQLQPDDGSTDLNATVAIVRQMVSRMDTMKLVKVMAVTLGSGSPPAPGTVNVLPLVNQIDGSGFATQHGIVSGLPFWRFQSGPWAIVADPAVGDYGYVICADRDSSNVVKTPGQASPGSRRKYNIADAVYIGGILNPVPAATLWLKSDGTWVLTDKPGNVVTSSSSGIAVTTVAGGDFTANGISLTKHTHAVTAAPGETGPPVG
jgi:hypothetical protein